MAAISTAFDLSITPAKVEELVRRIVDAVNPIEVIAFGSRARGQHRPDSDLDIAIIVDGDETHHQHVPGDITRGLALDVDLLTVPKQRYDKFRPWINTVHRQIDREGVRLYVRGGQSPNPGTFRRLC